MLMKRKERTEKEEKLLKKVTAEYGLFRCRMLLQPAEEVYNSCRIICFYECLYEYFRYCEKIRRDFINASEKEEGVLAQLWELYLKNEYLQADTWDEIESILTAYVKMKEPQAEGDNTYGQIDDIDFLKEEVDRQFVEELKKHGTISELLLKIMKFVLSERERAVKAEGITGMAEVLRDLGHDDSIIRAAIKKQYHLPDEEINKYL